MDTTRSLTDLRLRYSRLFYFYGRKYLTWKLLSSVCILFIHLIQYTIFLYNSQCFSLLLFLYGRTRPLPKRKLFIPRAPQPYLVWLLKEQLVYKLPSFPYTGCHRSLSHKIYPFIVQVPGSLNSWGPVISLPLLPSLSQPWSSPSRNVRPHSWKWDPPRSQYSSPHVTTTSPSRYNLSWS